MIKRMLVFLAASILLFVASYSVHKYMINLKDINMSFSLFSVYLFHVISAVIVYVIVEAVALKLPNQAGYAYLTSVFLKLGFFVLLFQASVFANEALTKPERISLVIPLFLFLITEAVAVSKLLNSK